MDAEPAFVNNPRLRDLEKHQTNLRWEAPIDQRLRALVDLLDDRGTPASRSEIVAALILSASEDPAAIAELVRMYRVSTAGDAAIAGAVVHDLADRRPGRIPRSQGRSG